MYVEAACTSVALCKVRKGIWSSDPNTVTLYVNIRTGIVSNRKILQEIEDVEGEEDEGVDEEHDKEEKYNVEEKSEWGPKPHQR